MKRLIVTAAVLVLLAAGAVTAAGLYGKNQEENAGRTQESGTDEADVLTGIFMGYKGFCMKIDSSGLSSSGLADDIVQLLQVVPRRYPEEGEEGPLPIAEVIDAHEKGYDKEEVLFEFADDVPPYIRFYFEAYRHPAGVNAMDHRDVILYRDGEDMIFAVQNPDNEELWSCCRVEGFGSWLEGEIVLEYQMSPYEGFF